MDERPGMDTIRVSPEVIDVAEVLSRISNPASGGTACFLGTTRDTFEGKRVLHLEYECYLSMAHKELQKLRDALRKEWSLTNVVLIHRTGTVPVSEVSVLVAASSVHRKEALEAVSFGINRIKSDIPIWKKELYDDGSCSWKENCVDCQ